MDGYFFIKKNVDQLSIELENKLPIKKTPESRQTCRKFLEEQMRVVYEKYGNKRPKNMPIPIFIEKLNNKSISECIRAYEERSGKKIKNTGMKQPISTPTRRKETGFSGTMDNIGGGGSDFAPIVNGQGEFISATGDMGQKMTFNNGNEQYASTRGRGASQEEIDKVFLERQQEYATRRGGGMFGNGRPPEINFALDGGDTRNTNLRKDANDMSQSLEGFGNLDMNSFGGSNFMGNNAGGMFGTGMMGTSMVTENNMGQMNNSNHMNQSNSMNMNQMNPINMNQMNMNPMNMNQMNMNQMNMNSMNMIPTHGIDLNAKVHQIMNERDKLDVTSPSNSRGHFNPMISPNTINNNMNNMNNNMNNMNNINNMNNNMNNMNNMNYMNNNMNNMNNNMNNMIGNNLNFRQGGDNTTMSMSSNMPPNIPANMMALGAGLPTTIQNMNSSQIQNLINSIKTDSQTFNPQVLQKMNAKDMELMIEQMKKNILGLSEKENVKTNEKDVDKKEILKKILELKKMQIKKQNALNETINKDKSSKKRKQKYDSESDKSEIIQESENDDTESSKSEKQVNKKNNKKTNNKTIIIKSDKYAEPEYYNDYMVQLDKPYKNIKCIELIDYKFPNMSQDIEITNDNNEFTFIFDNDEQSVQLDTGIYNIKNVINTIQEVLDDAEIHLQLKINNNKIIIQHTEKENFGLKNDEHSILRELGFTNETYEDNYKYVGEDEIKNITKMYMFIENISEKDPIGLIDLEKSVTPIKKQFKKPINELKEMIIKFKINKDDDDLVDFNKQPHELNFKLI